VKGAEVNIIITMGGLGSRFVRAGYDRPKYMIEAKGRTLFEWSMESLTGYSDIAGQYIFVVREEDHSEEFIREKSRRCGIDHFQIVKLDHLTDGQATTAMMALPYCDDNESIMIYNIDTYVESGVLKSADIRGDGYIPCFHAPGDHWSFVKLDSAGRAVEVREKQRISDNCTLGAYYFRSAGLYRSVYEEYYGDGRKLEKNEKYVAPLYNHMISKGMDVEISLIDFDRVHVLGTPEELNAFINES
jgi:dTDP-glucose pyrophosphorylase